MAIDVLARGSDGYEGNRGAFNVLLSQDPAAIATPGGAADVIAAIEYAKAEGLRVAAQRTGHMAEPLGDLSDTLLLRTAAMSSVSIDAERRIARVGAGALWGDIVPRASEIGLAACHGSSPTVGIVGYSLGGGVGWYGRKHGLQCNRVTAVELVDASGAERRVDADNDPELFWAVRGGGAGDFGIVTALEFELLPIAEVFGGALFFPLERAGEVLHAWHQWTAGAPEEITSVARVMAFPPLPDIPEPLRGNSFTVVEAVALLGEAEASEALAPLRGLSPAMDTFALQPPAGIAGLHMDPPEPVPYAGAAMLLGDLPGAAIDAFLGAVGPGSGSGLLSVELRHNGGAMGRGAPEHGALDTLPGSFLLFGVGVVPEPAAMAPTKGWLAAMSAAMEPWDAGQYLNFAETTLDVGVAFPPETVARLRAAKATYDPENLFHSSHPVAA